MVIAAQCMFVSGAKRKIKKLNKCQASKESCCVAVVPVNGRGSRSALPPRKGRQRCRLQLLSIRIRSHHFGYTCFAPVPPAIHLLLGQSKPVSNTPSTTKNQSQRQINIE